MKIKHGKTRMWRRAEARGFRALKDLVWREAARQRKRRLDKRSRGLNRTIPLARRKAIMAARSALRRTTAALKASQ